MESETHEQPVLTPAQIQAAYEELFNRLNQCLQNLGNFVRHKVGDPRALSIAATNLEQSMLWLQHSAPTMPELPAAEAPRVTLT